MTKVLGIDPGVNGALAYINQQEADVLLLPKLGKVLDIAAIAAWMQEHGPFAYAYMEKVASMPKQGVSGIFTFGRAVGSLETAVIMLGIPLRHVTPAAWKKVVLAGTKKDKQAAITYCSRAWPQVRLVPPRGRVKNSNLADALCIAEYGWREQAD